ncbi:MAG TPA: OB-fold domain-containing protein [Caulobacteraceae bacterium]|nr:OB-fold domain-containing protein [Caulobacteraceae bacterium]
MANDSGRRPIREGLLTGPLDDLSQVHLCGSRCAACGETSLGTSDICPNCGGTEVTPKALSDLGSLWTYTVVRHKPPGAYHGPDPFQPFALGLVELADGLRVMAPVEADIDSLAIGMPLHIRPYVLRTDEAGREVVAFTYRPA